MELTWHGHNCFRMMERGTASIVADPYDDGIGYAPLKLRADVVTVSHNDPAYNAAAKIRNVRLTLDSPGEYEIGGVFITGVASANTDQSNRLSLMFVFEFEGLAVCHLGALDHIPASPQIEELGAIDVLMVPVGGGGVLTGPQAVEVVGIMEPAIIVPMHYQTPDCTLRLDPLDRFLKEMGVSSIRQHDSDTLKVTKSGLPEETEIVVLDYKAQ